MNKKRDFSCDPHDLIPRMVGALALIAWGVFLLTRLPWDMAVVAFLFSGFFFIVIASPFVLAVSLLIDGLVRLLRWWATPPAVRRSRA